ncbi:unnamed protein product [Phytophthora fragariaefolia]|uniref:Unnamed protein product n=1 Tax=Phytophthora fragariaefolia TaxID=1490495 RepID=A0A9W7DB90_9STRA|nr:unnamed protein product [Phytophthora fragariaefolia]
MKRLNPTFNVELLTHYLTNRGDFPNRPIPKAVPLILDEDTGEELYIVEKLLKKPTRCRKRQWLVKWHGLPEHEATWESEAQIRHFRIGVNSWMSIDSANARSTGGRCHAHLWPAEQASQSDAMQRLGLACSQPEARSSRDCYPRGSAVTVNIDLGKKT